MIRYAMASLTPAVLLGLGCVAGGVWIWLGVASMTLVVFAADRLTRLPARPREDARALAHGNRLCVVLSAAHFCCSGWAFMRWPMVRAAPPPLSLSGSASACFSVRFQMPPGMS